VSIEPGRYPAILDPQAVYGFVSILLNSFDRMTAEQGRGPFVQAPDQQLQLWRTKLGMKVVDERVTISHDPMDPKLGTLPMPGMRPVTWIEKGVLSNLAYSHQYAVQTLQQDVANLPRSSFLMEGGETSMDEMIAATTNGVLVTRLGDVQILDLGSLLVMGQVRGGLWQIENGRVTRALTPMRFTDSPLLVLNAIEQIGPSVPVYSPSMGNLGQISVPALKVRELSLTAQAPQTAQVPAMGKTSAAARAYTDHPSQPLRG
jgi:predicted Zn-dependent protease